MTPPEVQPPVFFTSVWDAIENTPAEAENMKLCSALMIAVKDHIKHNGWTQAEAARRLGVARPRISDLMRGKVDLFCLNDLVNMAATGPGAATRLAIAELEAGDGQRFRGVGALFRAIDGSWPERLAVSHRRILNQIER
jgi:predicted XRE-type DNA-binding protein